MRNKAICLQLPKHDFTWNIKRSLLTNLMPGFSIKSPYFECFRCRWSITLYPNLNGYIRICILALSNEEHRKKDTEIYTRCAVGIREANTKYTFSAAYSKDAHTYTINDAILSTYDLSQLQMCTAELQIELIDVYQEKCNLTDRFC